MRSTWRHALIAAPGVGFSLLPKLACPMLANLRRLVGTAYLLPLTIAFLLQALFAMALRARVRRGYRLLLLGLFASVGIVLGKFVWDSRTLLYGAVGLLIVASIWNTLPQWSASCPSCETTNVANRN